MPTKKPRLKADPPPELVSTPVAPEPKEPPGPKESPAPTQPPQLLALLLGGIVGELAAARRAVSTLAAELAQREQELAQVRAQLMRLHDDNLDRELDMNLLRYEIAKRDKQYTKVLRSLSFRLGMGATAPMRWLFQKTAGSSKPPG